MKIYLGADHNGYEMKNALREYLHHHGHDIEDIGAKTLTIDDDYPKYAYELCTAMIGDQDDDVRGILLCGSGQGMAIAANRVHGIRAALAWNEASATNAWTDDKANVLSIPAHYLSLDEAEAMVDAWLAARFKNDPKYQRRIDEIERLYG